MRGEKIDNLILQSLTDNARISKTIIGKRVRLTKSSVFSHIKNLEKQNLILKYTTILNYSQLGFKEYFLFISTEDNFLENKELFNRLTKDSIIEIYFILGEYNILIRFISKIESTCDLFLNRILKLFKINSYLLTEICKYSFYPGKMFFFERKKLLPKKKKTSKICNKIFRFRNFKNAC